MPCGGNRRRARHIGCLQGIQIKLTAWNHLHTVVAPIWTLLYAPHMNSPLSSCLDECPTVEAPNVLKKIPDEKATDHQMHHRHAEPGFAHRAQQLVEPVRRTEARSLETNEPQALHTGCYVFGASGSCGTRSVS
jgi:hypothetical protein